MQIITASPHDAPVFARLNRHVHQLHLDNAPDSFHEPTHEEATTSFRRQLSEKSAFAFLAIEADEAVGYLLAFVQEREANPFCPERRFLYIEQISVEPDQQGQGVGRALMDAALQLAAQERIEDIEVSTWAFNRKAQAFFESVGFEPRMIRYRMRLTGICWKTAPTPAPSTWC